MIAIATDPSAHRLFDAAAWASGLGAGWIVSRWRLQEARKDVPQDPWFLASLAIGAIFGAYLAGTLPALAMRSGVIAHSVAGALAGAIVAVELYKLRRGFRRSTGGVFVTPFAVGIVVGRWGCLFAGLPDGTYGVPTTLPWGVDLGDGVARHPVQIYESGSMLLFLAVYLTALALRAPRATNRGFYFMAIWYGAQRFIWEFLKPYPPVFGSFTIFHLICIGLVAYGLLWLGRSRRA